MGFQGLWGMRWTSSLGTKVGQRETKNPFSKTHRQEVLTHHKHQEEINRQGKPVTF